MAVPFFYTERYQLANKFIELDEVTSKHIAQVLRMKAGEPLQLTDGNGILLICKISISHKHKSVVEILETKQTAIRSNKISIGISLLKNTSRFEWFLEKATEIGVAEIIPMICDRTEKQNFRKERMQSICISALLQSQQCYLPKLQAPIKFENLMAEKFETSQKLIAHCSETQKQHLNQAIISTTKNKIILIGPEGDFTNKEIELALQHKFIPVSLGDTRLRTETAGIVAAIMLCCI